MTDFEIYTIGSGYYLEKILNAIRLIFASDKGSFVSIIKASAILSLVLIMTRGAMSSDFKGSIKWFLGVVVLVGLFINTKARVHIYDQLPNAYGVMQSPRTVDDVPWGLAVLGSVTSSVGNKLSEKFDSAFSGVFVNPQYQKTGILFGSKLIEDISKLKISDMKLQGDIINFYKRCVIPDVRMGHARANGYTINDLTNSEDILGLLVEKSSKARMIQLSGSSNNNSNSLSTRNSSKNSTSSFGYMSCKDAANYIARSVKSEVDTRIPKLSASLISAFYPEQANNSSTNTLFSDVLANSYGLFLRKASNDAKDILLQNVMINAIGDSASYGKAYGAAATEAMTNGAFYSVSQIAGKFVPLLRAVLECLFYGCFPMVLILMVTPMGLEVLKNYSFSFVYLQMWQPMYAILFSIAGSWGKYYASGIDSVTIASHSSISMINADISAISGYMLAMVPVISLYITKGMVASMGNLATSILQIPQSSAISNSEQAVKGNYQLGTTSVGTHAYNTTSANKHDDNYAHMSGMKTFQMQSGSLEKMYSDNRRAIDVSSGVSNLAGLANANISSAIGNRFDENINNQSSIVERDAISSVESASSGYSKMLGFDKNFNKSSSAYQAWYNNKSTDERSAIDTARSEVLRSSAANNTSVRDTINASISGNLSASAGGKAFGSKIAGNISAALGLGGTRSGSRDNSVSNSMDIANDMRLSESIGSLNSISASSAHQQNNNVSDSLNDSIRSDLAKSKSASHDLSKSYDKLVSLQESRGRFEQNSASVTQDLTNKWVEEGISKYGAAGFEDNLKNNPEEVRKSLDSFVDKNLSQKFIDSDVKFTSQKDNTQSVFSSKVQDQNQAHTNNTNNIEDSSTKNRDSTLMSSGSLKQINTDAVKNSQDQSLRIDKELINKQNNIEQRKIIQNTQLDKGEENVKKQNEKSLLSNTLKPTKLPEILKHKNNNKETE